MAQLPNINVTIPSTWVSKTTSGTTSRASARRRTIRTVSGYTGKFVKQKPLPLHAFSMRFYDYGAFNTSRNGLGTENNSGDCLAPDFSNHDLSLDKPNVANLRNQALSRLNDKFRGNLDLSVDIAEAGKTARMLKISDQIQTYHKHFLKNARSFGLLKGPANLWLAYTYGLKPLVQSLYGAADESLRVVVNRIESVRGRASQTVENPRVRMDGCWGGTETYRTKGTFKVSKTIGIRCRVPQFDIARWSSLNPVSLAWELMPYSFVVDWFLNVGGYLRDMETGLLYGSRFVSGYETELQVWNLVVDNLYTDVTGYYSKTTGFSQGCWIDRVLLTGYPIPSLPSFKANLGSSRLISAASLLAQQLEDRRHLFRR